MQYRSLNLELCNRSYLYNNVCISTKEWAGYTGSIELIDLNYKPRMAEKNCVCSL